MDDLHCGAAPVKLTAFTEFMDKVICQFTGVTILCIIIAELCPYDGDSSVFPATVTILLSQKLQRKENGTIKRIVRIIMRIALDNNNLGIMSRQTGILLRINGIQGAEYSGRDRFRVIHCSRQAMIPQLTSTTVSLLEKYSKSYTEKGCYFFRSKIILKAVAGESNKDIGLELRCHPNTAAKWRNRFIDYAPALSVVESAAPEELEDMIRILLSDEYRSSTPAKYADSTRCMIKLIACQDSSDYGFTASH